MAHMVQDVIEFLNSAYVRLTTRDEEGQGLVEYALILVLIAIVVIAVLTILGQKVSNVFQNVSAAINK